MSVVSVQARSFILALFIRDDGERFLLGDNGFDFKDSQLHFAANTIENDEVAKQGTDGTMLAGQVRRSSVQEFDGYVGDAADPKVKIEQMRRDFIGFFAVGYHFRVIYVDCNRNAWQRKGGYIVDAPEVKELWQLHPEYHVGLNFEDVNYYSYDENEDGEEILANVLNVPISTDVSGGLEWDMLGAVWSDAETEGGGGGGASYVYATAKGTNIVISDAIEGPTKDFRIYAGDMAYADSDTPSPMTQVAIKTTTGAVLLNKQVGKNLIRTDYYGTLGMGATVSLDPGIVYLNGTASSNSSVYLAPFTVPDSVTTATLSVKPSGRTSGNGYISLQIWNGASYNSLSNNISFGANNSEVLTLTPGSIYRVRLTLRSDVFNNGSVKIQLEAGSSATAWEAPDVSQKILNLGYNLFDKTKATLGYKVNYTNGQLEASADMMTSDFIPVTRGQYNFVDTDDAAEAGNARYKSVVYYRKNKTSVVSGSTNVSMNNQSFGLNIPAGSHYVRFSTYTSQIDLTRMTRMSILPYASYAEPIELCKIGDAIDYIYTANDKWYKHKTIGKIDSYDGETIPGAYMSTSGELSTGATVYYVLGAPEEVEITDATITASLNDAKSWATDTSTTFYSGVMASSVGEISFDYPISEGGDEPVVVTGGGLVWEEGGEGGPTTVINNSITNVPLTWTVFGPAINPTLENTTTGEALEYVGTVADGQTLVIDMGEQTAMLDGTNVISDITGDYVSLAPGTNILTFSAIGDTGPSKIGWSEIVG